MVPLFCCRSLGKIHLAPEGGVAKFEKFVEGDWGSIPQQAVSVDAETLLAKLVTALFRAELDQ